MAEHVWVIHGDATTLPLADNSVDAIVCDPPYGLEFMGKEWDSFGKASDVSRALRGETSGLPIGTGNGFQDWCGGWAAEALRVIKPGGYLLAFGGSRTWHRLACAIEDAGFELRDSIAWLYGSGFPKSLDVSKAIDKAAGAEREVTGSRKKLQSYGSVGVREVNTVYGGGPDKDGVQEITAPATDAARQWQGWGTALKPAHEPIVVARKPLQGTVAANVQQWGTGALNIAACRVTADAQRPASPTSPGGSGSSRAGSSVCTCPERGAARSDRTASTSPLASSAASPVGRNDLPASARPGESARLPPPGSPGDCRPSARSGDERAPSVAVDARASAQPLPDADALLDPDATSGRIPASLSTACPHCTAGDVQREPTRAGESSADMRYTERGGTNFAPMPGVRGGAAEGRWPSNVVLSHSPSCEQIGTRKVRNKGGSIGVDTNAAAATRLNEVYGEETRGRGAWQAYGDGDGMETVPVWECAEGCPVAMLDQQSGTLTSGKQLPTHKRSAQRMGASGIYGASVDPSQDALTETYGDSGGASRFFPTFRYQAKAPSRERPVGPDGTKHPTCKPLDLMRWLVRLVTPPGGTVLDPFAGSGTTLEAAQHEGFTAIGVERDATYLPLIEQRISRCSPTVIPPQQQPRSRKRRVNPGQLDMFGDGG